MKFAPVAFRETRIKVTKDVEKTLKITNNLNDISVMVLKNHPKILPTLRMSTCPPIAVDRLIGLSNVQKSLVLCLEEGRLPKRMSDTQLDTELSMVAAIIRRMVDPDIFAWLVGGRIPQSDEVHRAATIVADRLSNADANPIIRNAQETRQLTAIATWLEARGYRKCDSGTKYNTMPAGTYGFRINIPVSAKDLKSTINIPIDTVVMPLSAKPGTLPLMIEAKSAGDYTNTNKRRKEEAQKINQLRSTYGETVRFVLFLCGYFDTQYLGYEAGEGIDWVWEHRIDDLAQFEI
ncbi:MAG: XamI family restriction endonuclease [Myxococcales bacterium]|nr:XamI family restriction endonuclease [Myxococcales bacterium]